MFSQYFENLEEAKQDRKMSDEAETEYHDLLAKFESLVYET